MVLLLPPSTQQWCRQPRGLPHLHLPKKSIDIQKAGKINRQILELFRRGFTYPWLAPSQECSKTQTRELLQLPAHLARTAWCCPSRCTGSYLHECVEKLSHIFEAAIGKLVEFQPGESSLDNLVVQVNVRLGLGKAFHHKCSEPDWGEQKKRHERRKRE